MYRERWRLFLAIGVLFIPLAAVISLLEAVVLGGFGLLGLDATGESAGAFVLLVVGGREHADAARASRSFRPRSPARS